MVQITNSEMSAVARDPRFVPKSLYQVEAAPPMWYDFEVGDSDGLKCLKGAYQLILDPSDWCRWADAEDSTGRRVDARGTMVARLDAWGALLRAEWLHRLPEKTAVKVQPAYLSMVNSIFGHAAVLGYLERRIKRSV